MIEASQNQPLPVELWKYILRLATVTPGAFDVSCKAPLDFPPENLLYSASRKSPFRRTYYESSSTKATVALVCKSWRDINLPSMFEIVVWNERNHPQLLKLLNPAHNLCRFIRRMEVDAIGYDYPEIAAVIQACSQLIIYKHDNAVHRTIDHDPMRGSEDFVTALLTHCGKTLHHLQLQHFKLPLNFPELVTLHAMDLQV